jgi:NTE family protein
LGFSAAMVMLLVAASMAEASRTEPSVVTDRPRVGLVLSGGGARGAAHVGVIQVLEELRVPVDYITGTSMGSIVGGFYAMGMTIDEMEKAFTELDWAGAFEDKTPREDRSFRRKRDDDDFLVKAKPGISGGKIKLPAGLIQGQQQNLILKSITMPVATLDNFDQLSIPYRAVATDIGTGEAVVLGSGDLATAMRASMSVPGVFAPVEMEGKLLVDGGVSNNLPVDVARDMGADVLIVVDISTPLTPREKIHEVLAITKQLTAIMTRSNTERSIASLTKADLFIVPDLGDIATGDFHRAKDAIAVGVKAALENRTALQHFSLSEAEYQAYLEARAVRKNGPPVIEFVRIKNESRLSDEVLTSRLHVQVGEPLDVKALEKDIRDIYGLDLFEIVKYDILREGGQTGLEVEAIQKSWGPNYLQFGIALEGDFEGENSFNLALGYLRTELNSLNGEWRTIVQVGEEPRFFTELYQPLDVRLRYFVNPRIEYRKINVNIIDDGDVLSEYRVSAFRTGLEGGRNLGNWGEMRLGWRWGRGDAKVQVGDPALPDLDFDIGNVFLRFTVDEVDNFNFPHSGGFAELEGLMSRGTLGADTDFEQITLQLLGAKSWGRHTVLLGTNLASTLDDDAPLQSRFRLGGFLNLSGLKQDELSGQHAGVVQLVYYYRILDIALLPAYLGGSLEGGNVWEDKDDIGFDDVIAAGSLFLGVDSFLGPLYLGYGRAEAGRSSFYMFLGRTF